jgi:CIC family chloride channel protein
MNLFAPLVCASVVSAMVSRSFFGIEPWYVVPPFPPTAPLELPWFVVMGILCGGVSAVFLQFLRTAKEQYNRTKLPIYARMMLAGLATGIIAAIGFPGVCGNGYYVTNAILHGQFDAGAAAFSQLGGLFSAKLLATAITVGAGTVGGVFTPTMYLGAGAGALFGMVLHHFGCGLSVPTGAFALVGMGATLSGTTRSPLLAMIMVFEISLDYSIMPPLMLGCVVSVLVSRQLHKESVYTEHMKLKGLSLLRETEQAGAAMDKTVGDLMQPPVPPLRETATLKKIADRFLSSSNNFVPIVDGGQRLIGVIALHDLKDFLHDSQGLAGAGIIALDVMHPPPRCLTPGQRLLDALPLVLESELRNIPVVSTLSENRLVGSLSRAQVLAAFSEVIAQKSKPAG